MCNNFEIYFIYFAFVKYLYLYICILLKLLFYLVFNMIYIYRVFFMYLINVIDDFYFILETSYIFDICKISGYIVYIFCTYHIYIFIYFFILFILYKIFV